MQQARCLNEHFAALQGVGPPDKEQRGLAVESQGSSGLLAVQRAKMAQVYAAGNNGHALARDAVNARKLVALVGGGDSDAVHAADDAPFVFNAQRRFHLFRPRLLFQPRQRVEHRHMRNIPGFGKLHARHAGKPVMAVNQVIVVLLARGELLHPAHKFGDMLEEVIFRQPGDGASFDVNNARVFAKWEDAGSGGVSPAGKNIDNQTMFAKFAGQFSNVNVHASGFGTLAERRQRRGMQAEHRYSKAHSSPRFHRLGRRCAANVPHFLLWRAASGSACHEHCLC